MDPLGIPLNPKPPINPNYILGSCRNYGPFYSTYYLGYPKGTIILTTTHMDPLGLLGFHPLAGGSARGHAAGVPDGTKRPAVGTNSR